MAQRIVLVSMSFLLLLFTCNYSSTDSKFDKVQLGMTSANLLLVNPKAYRDEGNSDRFVSNESLFGISGKWVYYFSHDQLKWYMFNADEGSVSRDSFNKFLSATESQIDTYTKKLGQPKKVRHGIKEFQDPTVQRHNGYLVEQVSWQTEAEKRIVEYSFIGGNKGYRLLLSIEVRE